MTSLMQDLRYGLRTLARSPGFTVVAMIVLALGIGANTAIFSVVDAMLLRPLPYADAGRLVFLSEHSEQVPDMSISYLNYLDWERQNSVFSQIAVFREDSLNLTGVDRPERVEVWSASRNFLTTLGVKPILGRDFLPEEDKPGANLAVLVSYGYWRQRYAGDPTVVGRTLTLDGEPATVVGILPPGFKFAYDASVYAPIGRDRQLQMARDNHSGTYGVARLKPGVTLEQARTQMLAIADRLAQQYPDTNKGNSVVVIPLRDELVQDVRPALLVLLAAVGLVLLIACVNVANLLLARAAARKKEIAIRGALGASRTRVVRQLLTESLVLASMGGALGLLLGYWGIGGLTSLIPADFRNLIELRIDSGVLAFTLGVSLLTGLLFGLVPAFQTTRPDLNEALKEGGRSSTSGLQQHRFRSGLAASEVALSLVLLAGAGLVLRSVTKLLAVDPGFDAHNVLTLRISLPEARYPAGQQAALFFQHVLERVRPLPGVLSAGVVTPLPLTGQGWQTDFYIEGKPMPPPGQLPNSDFHTVDPGYFQTLKIPLLRGRYFTNTDTEKAPLVALINQAMAERYWPGQDPVGRRFHLEDWVTVVGIVGNTKQYGLDRPYKTEFYRPYLQHPLYYMTLAVRTGSNPLDYVNAVLSQVEAVDKDQPVYFVRTLDQYLDESVAPRKVTIELLGGFATLALVLAAVGVYGVISYSVAQRTHEIGVRMALGASPEDVVKQVVGQGLLLTLIGVGAGLVAAFAAARLMSSLLYGIGAADPTTFAAVATGLAVVAALASYIPARRAAKVDPLVALRYE
jgi:putative ABC transport system permease protein